MSLKNNNNRKPPGKQGRAGTAHPHQTEENLIRDIFPSQRTLGETGIADIKIDIRSRDGIPLTLLGLQHIYRTPELKDKAFDILKDVLPVQAAGGQGAPASTELGRLGMGPPGLVRPKQAPSWRWAACARTPASTASTSWRANRTVRLMPGIAEWDGQAFPLQVPKGNLALSAPERLARVNQAVAWAGYALLGE
jgi:transposase, IS5 family